MSHNYDKLSPSILGIGILGIGKYNSKHKFYEIWRGILKRCYCESTQKRQPTYIGCSVDEKWLNFQNFAEWCEQNYIDGFVLDKDILFKGNKIYGPDTCCFVPNEINLLFTKSNKKRGNFPIGVSYQKLRNNFRASIRKNNKQINLGDFKTPEEAFLKYKFWKESYIKDSAEEWKNIINPILYNTLINYKVEITD